MTRDRVGRRSAAGSGTWRTRRRPSHRRSRAARLWPRFAHVSRSPHVTTLAGTSGVPLGSMSRLRRPRRRRLLGSGTPYDQQLADVLHRRRIQLDADALEHRLPARAIVAEDADLDQLVCAQIDVDLMQNARREPVLADCNDRVQMMSLRPQLAALRRGQGHHARRLPELNAVRNRSRAARHRRRSPHLRRRSGCRALPSRGFDGESWVGR